MSEIDDVKTNAIAVMLLLLKTEVTEENASKVLKLFDSLKKMGCHDICDYYRPDVESYISKLQTRVHNEWSFSEY